MTQYKSKTAEKIKFEISLTDDNCSKSYSREASPIRNIGEPGIIFPVRNIEEESIGQQKVRRAAGRPKVNHTELKGKPRKLFRTPPAGRDRNARVLGEHSIEEHRPLARALEHWHMPTSGKKRQGVSILF